MEQKEDCTKKASLGNIDLALAFGSTPPCGLCSNPDVSDWQLGVIYAARVAASLMNIISRVLLTMLTVCLCLVSRLEHCRMMGYKYFK